jgi:hypothetical protein
MKAKNHINHSLSVGSCAEDFARAAFQEAKPMLDVARVI